MVSDFYVPFSVNQATILDGTGAALLQFRPTGEQWNIAIINVKASSHTLESVCTVYLGQPSTINQVDITYTGSSGDTSQTNLFLTDGQILSVQWVGGDPGATVTATITGLRTQIGGGFRGVR